MTGWGSRYEPSHTVDILYMYWLCGIFEYLLIRYYGNIF